LKIIDFPHTLIHSYDSINDETSWNIIANKLPVLLNELERLLADSTIAIRRDVGLLC